MLCEATSLQSLLGRVAQWYGGGLQIPYSRVRFSPLPPISTLVLMLMLIVHAGMAELVDAGDLKSPGGDTVPVRLRLSVPQIVVQKDLSKPISLNAGRFFYWCMTKR